ncbi:MAG TPA: glycine cleavage T C-terminal barrel domain-containing protein, partial [Gaiellaceae bacterium]
VCYPLHGNDIGPQWDAISSGLGWACALDTEFTGVERLRAVKEQGPAHKLVPFVMTDKAIPRQGMAILDGAAVNTTVVDDTDAIGEVTSGSHSPMLDVGIGMGYVDAASSKSGAKIVIDVRGRPRHAKIVKKPIYKKEGA